MEGPIASQLAFLIKNECPASVFLISRSVWPNCAHMCGKSISATGSVVSTRSVSPTFSDLRFFFALKTGSGQSIPCTSRVALGAASSFINCSTFGC